MYVSRRRDGWLEVNLIQVGQGYWIRFTSHQTWRKETRQPPIDRQRHLKDDARYRPQQTMTRHQ
jgi:hypothetical protein